MAADPRGVLQISKVEQACNYLQGVEGGIDTAHSSFLHNNDLQNPNQLRLYDKHPELEVDITDYGFRYVGIRHISEDQSYIRGYQFIMPVQKLQGNFLDFYGKEQRPRTIYGHLWVPKDDEHTDVYNFNYGVDDSAQVTAEWYERNERSAGRGAAAYEPGSFRMRQNLANDFLIDREVQRTRTYTGIAGVNTQDVAIQEGMGPVEDRSREFLGTTDKAIVACRQLLLEAVEELESGIALRGTEPEAARDVRGADLIVPRGVPWRDAMKEALVAVW